MNPAETRSPDAVPSRRPHLLIRPGGATFTAALRELAGYREMLALMVRRDLTVMYRQSVLGSAWAVIHPLFLLLVFNVVFGRLAGVPHDGIPYPLFFLAGLVPWIYFSNSLHAASGSLAANADLITKIYFPRLIIPLTPVISRLLDLCLGLAILAAFAWRYGVAPRGRILLLPLLVLILVSTALGLGALLSAWALQYRDVKFALPILVSTLMYLAPVVFPASLVLEKFGTGAYLAYGLFPVTAVIEGLRAMVAPGGAIPWALLAAGGIGALVTLLVGVAFFQRAESRFADIA